LNPFAALKMGRCEQRIAKHRVVGSIGDPSEQMHVARGQVAGHGFRIGKTRRARVEVEVAPAAQAAAAVSVRAIEPDRRRGQLKALKGVGILLDQRLGVGHAVRAKSA
jgi:hypothetical protein